MSSMWIKITKCDKDTAWYFRKVGNLYEVVSLDGITDFIVRKDMNKSPLRLINTFDTELKHPSLIVKLLYKLGFEITYIK